MAEGNLSFKEFCHLSKEDRIRRYGELSDADKFKARCSEPSDTNYMQNIPCNSCVYRIKNDAVCAAYPDGINPEHIRQVMKNPETDCGKGYRFQKK
jgi:hypothetical protein